MAGGKRLRFYALAVALGLGVRAWLVAGTDGGSLYNRWSTVDDGEVYDRFAWNLAAQGVLGVGRRPSAFILPAYPVFVAGIYSLSGRYPGAVRWVQVLLGILMVMMLGRVARLLGGPGAELLMVAMGAVYPYFLYFIPQLLTENIFLPAFAGMLWTALRMGRGGGWLDGFLHGVCLAAAAMTRAIGIFIEPALLLLARPWVREGRAGRLRGLGLGYLFFALAWGSWMARNRAVFGEIVPLDTRTGWYLYYSQMVTLDRTGEAWRHLPYGSRRIAEGAIPSPREELAISKEGRRLAFKNMRGDWKFLPSIVLKNSAAMWLCLDFSEVRRHSGLAALPAVAGWLSYLFVLCFGLAGFLWARRRGEWEFCAAVLWAVFVTMAIYATTSAGNRYRATTIDPFLMILASCWLSERLSRLGYLDVHEGPAIAGKAQ
ncbi:MAG: glycosyltransferase family 39 protein [Elusimicrobia bacterium]|nr:glycosyltransferase family 39 protein [Elusimicrobiota bacterium]